MKNTFTIAKKELFSYINTPIAYIVTISFIIPSYFLFWQQALISNEASLRGFFALLPWFLLLVIPALTMRSLANEQNQNTIELLLSHAIQEWEIVIGKFLGILGFYILILFTTLSLPLTLIKWGNPDTGIIIGQYLGAILLGASLISMGILISAWFKQSITAFLVSAGIGFGWILIGLDIVTLAIPWPFKNIIHEIALLPHSNQLARGLIELRDVSYFIIVTGVLLALSAIKLSETKLTENKIKKTHMYIGATIIAAIGIILNLVLTSWPLQLDLTIDQKFSLSQGTKNTLQNLPDIVSITLYASQNLPAQIQVTRREIEDTLKDYSRYGKGKLKISTLHPETNSQVSQQAERTGVNQIQFNTLSNGKFSVESGYLGIVINYGDKHETIPFVENSGNLEYDLTQKIRKLTIQNRPTIGFLTDFNTKSTFTDLSAWNQDIQTQYQSTNVSLNTPDSTLNVNTLIIPGPKKTAKESTASAKIKNFLANNGKILFLLDGIEANTQLGIANQIDNGWDNILTNYGLAVKQNMAYDTQLNENIRVGQGFLQYIIPYPFWVRALPAKKESPIETPEGVLLGWPSQIEINNKIQNTQTFQLLQTSSAGGTVKGTLSIAPDATPKQGQGTPILLAVASQKNDSRIVLIGDSDLATNNFYQNSPANQTFLSNILDWLVADKTIIQVPRRQYIPALFKFKKPQDAIVAQYGNTIGIPIAIAIFGFWWLRRRNKLTKRTYQT